MRTKITLLLLLAQFSFIYAQKSHKVNVIRLDKPYEDINQSIYFADYDASRRGSLIIHNSKDINNPVRILSEPPPDAIVAFTTAINNRLDVEGKLNTSQSVSFTQAISELTKRNTTIVVLRDALYRLNEFNFNNPNALTNEQYIKQFDKILDLAERITENEKRELKNDSIKQTKELIETKAKYGFHTEIPIYFQVSKKSLLESIEKLIEKLNESGYNADGPELIENIEVSKNMIKYFNEKDLKKAQDLKIDLTNFGIKDLEIVKAGNPKNLINRFEVWLKE